MVCCWLGGVEVKVEVRVLIGKGCWGMLGLILVVGVFLILRGIGSIVFIMFWGGIEIFGVFCVLGIYWKLWLLFCWIIYIMKNYESWD